MPSNQILDPKFQNALRNAIQRFKLAKAPLARRHQTEIAMMEAVVNNNDLTSREMRDRVGKTCKDINHLLWNWVGGSLLVEYVEEVLSASQFNVERIYENVINRQDETIESQKGDIDRLKEENIRFKKNPQWYADELQLEIKQKDNIIIEATEQLKKNTTLIQSLEKSLIVREEDYRVLRVAYQEELKKNNSEKQNEKSNPQADSNYSSSFFESKP
jgi:hypothetical protein